MNIFKIKLLFVSADNTIHDVSGEWTIGKLKLEIRSCLKKENFSVYFHNGVEIEFDDETLLGQLFGPEIINEQGVAQVDVFLPSAALVTIKSESNFEILEASGEILSLGPENSKTVDLKRIGYLVSLFSNCMFLNPNNIFNMNSNCFNLLDMRNLQEQVKKHSVTNNCFPFTVLFE